MVGCIDTRSACYFANRNFMECRGRPQRVGSRWTSLGVRGRRGSPAPDTADGLRHYGGNYDTPIVFTVHKIEMYSIDYTLCIVYDIQKRFERRKEEI